MAAEVLRELVTDVNGMYVDATVGGAGHAEALMRTLGQKARLVGIDRDQEAVTRSRSRLSAYGDRVSIIQGDYRDIADICHAAGVRRISGALLDLGLSSLQLDDAGRGFAYRFDDSPLDLRFDTTRGEPASDWLNRVPVAELAQILARYGEEPRARRIAKCIVAARAVTPITRTGQLSRILSEVVGAHGAARGRSAARIWQALRIHTNRELDAIPVGVNDLIDLLEEGGRLVVITYQSLEDRIVKNTMRDAARECDCPPVYPHCICGARQRGRLVYRRVLRPQPVEVKANPRAKAAKMRVFEKGAADSAGRRS